MKKVVYLDMDGVVADFDAQIQRLHPSFKALEEKERQRHRLTYISFPQPCGMFLKVIPTNDYGWRSTSEH